MKTQTYLNGPCSSISQSANGVSFNLTRQLLNHVNLARASLTVLETSHHVGEPRGSLTARCALSTGLVLVESRKTRDGRDNIRRLVHDNHSCSSQTRLDITKGIEIHEDIIANVTGQDWDRGTSGNDSQKVIPTTLDTTAVLLNEFLQGDGHLLLNCARVVDMSRDTEQLGTGVTGATESSKPLSTTSQDGGGNSDSLDVGDGGGASEKTDISREWGLQARLTSLTLDRLDQSSLFTANVGPSTTVNVHIKIVSGTAGVLSDQTSLVSLINSDLEVGGLVVELSTDINVS